MPSLTLAIRTAAEPLSIVSDMRRQIRAVDPDQAVSQIMTLEQLVATAMAQPRFNASLLFFFAAGALVLAPVGIYGVMAHVVRQRTREIGLRLALGAQTADVLRLILGQGMKPALIGVLMGLGGGLGLTRLIENLLFGVSATDPLTFAMIALLLTVVSIAGLLCAGAKGDQGRSDGSAQI
jgi:ABC-type antimicrobial peptide transport system permease subunit